MVDRLPKMVDMALDAKEQSEIMSPSPPKYPYGLCICLCTDEVEKLGLSDCEVGETLHIFAMGRVTSVSVSDNEVSGPNHRLEIQLTHIAGESEDYENKKESGADKAARKLYNKK